MAGGGGEQTSTVHQSNLPEYAQPYYETMMNRTLGESMRPYQPYEGQRLAGMSAQTGAGLDMASNWAQNSDIDGLHNAMGAANYATDASLGLSGYQAGGVQNGYQAGQFHNTYTGPQQGNYQSGIFDEAQFGFGQNGLNEVGVSNFTDAARDHYMSPYMQSVTDHAKMKALQEGGQQLANLNANAATTGAFGGSRAAIQSQLAENSLMDRLTGLEVEGRQSAFENAQQQFERDRQAQFASGTQNQNTALQMAQANQQALQNAQQMGEQSRQYGFGANEEAHRNAAQLNLQQQQLSDDANRAMGQMNMSAQELSERFRQSGNEMNLSALQQAMTGAQTQGAMQQAMDEAYRSRIQTQLGVGQAQEDYYQQQLDQSYNDYVNQRDAERQNLQFLSSILRGVPISANQDITTTQPTNPLAGLLGTGMGLQSLYQMSQQQPG